MSPYDDFDKDWVPADYLNEYYKTQEVAPDEDAIYRFVFETLKRSGRTYERAIEFGCGPTIHHSLPLVSWCQQLHLADYLPSNLAEVARWLRADPDAHNWDVYVHGVLEREWESIEGPVSSEAIEIRKQLLRDRVTALKQGDIRRSAPLEDNAQYDLVTSFYCADSITASKEAWRQYIRNLSSLLAPGGLLILSALHQAKHYSAGRNRFPSANISASDMEEVLSEEKFIPHSVKVRVEYFSGWEEEGFDGVCMASACAANIG